MTWDEVKELGPLYALGALDEETARALEDYLRTATPDQQREIAEWREVTAFIPLGLPDAPVPAPHLKDRLMSRISAGSQTVETADSTAKVLPFDTPRRTESRATRWLLMAATVLLSFASVYLLWQNLKLRGENENLAKKVEESETRITKLISPATKWVSMSGVEAPNASAKLVWDTHLQTWVIYVYNLPEPPSDMVYQLWYVTKDSPVSAAILNPKPDGSDILNLTLPSGVVNNLAATAVTLEPKPGSPQPTGKFYLKGSI